MVNRAVDIIKSFWSKDDQEPDQATGTCAPGIWQKNFIPAEELALHEDPLHQCMELERYGIIIDGRSNWADHREFDSVYKSAAAAIDKMFAIVPEGYASLAQTVSASPGGLEEDIQTKPFMLARHVVTNTQFQKFVDAGGYDNLNLWPKDVWPHLIDFRDSTDCLAPRYWRKGRGNKALANHPVVGISYYEATAYCRWAGFDLPSEAQWQMAASWRLQSCAQIMHRYSWGDAMDTTRCNIWNSGIGTTVPVGQYQSGAAPNGVLQLIGNVWEWTGSDFSVVDDDGRQVVGDMVMKAIRGGAFDTYFVRQATSYFRTGLPSLARVHNVGFRCATDVPNAND